MRGLVERGDLSGSELKLRRNKNENTVIYNLLPAEMGTGHHSMTILGPDLPWYPGTVYKRNM